MIGCSAGRPSRPVVGNGWPIGAFEPPPDRAHSIGAVAIPDRARSDLERRLEAHRQEPLAPAHRGPGPLPQPLRLRRGHPARRLRPAVVPPPVDRQPGEQVGLRHLAGQQRRLRELGAAQRLACGDGRGGHGLRVRPLSQRSECLGITPSTFRAPPLVATPTPEGIQNCKFKEHEGRQQNQHKLMATAHPTSSHKAGGSPEPGVEASLPSDDP